MRGKKINNLHELNDLARDKKSVTVPNFSGFKTRKPAVFIMNLQAQMVWRMFCTGMYLYISEKPKKDFSESVRRKHA